MYVNGHGSITQLDKSKSPYRCREWMLQVTTNNGRISKRFKGPKSEAQAELLLFINRIENDKYFKDEKFKNYSNYWLNYRKESKRYSPNTIETNSKFVIKLNSIFGNYNLRELTPKLIRDQFLSIKQTANPDKELSGTYKKHMFFTLNSILNMALDDELIERNPCKKVQPPKNDTKEKKALKYPDFIYLLDCLDKEELDGRVILIYLMAVLGLRRQEAVALTWNDIDWNRHLVHVNKAYKYSDRSIGDPKSKAGNRYCPMQKRLENKLIEWKIVCNKNLIECDEIACNTLGTRFIGQSYYGWWKKFRKKYNIEKIHFHELRHTNFSILSEKMSPYVLQKYAGWSNLDPTKIYIHPEIEEAIKAVNSFDF